MSLLHDLTHRVSCRDATRLLSQKQGRSLRWDEWVKLRLHLLVCIGCSRFDRQMRIVRSAMKKFRD